MTAAFRRPYIVTANSGEAQGPKDPEEPDVWREKREQVGAGRALTGPGAAGVPQRSVRTAGSEVKASRLQPAGVQVLELAQTQPDSPMTCTEAGGPDSRIWALNVFPPLFFLPRVCLSETVGGEKSWGPISTAERLQTPLNLLWFSHPGTVKDLNLNISLHHSCLRSRAGPEKVVYSPHVCRSARSSAVAAAAAASRLELRGFPCSSLRFSPSFFLLFFFLSLPSSSSSQRPSFPPSFPPFLVLEEKRK